MNPALAPLTVRRGYVVRHKHNVGWTADEPVL